MASLASTHLTHGHSLHEQSVHLQVIQFSRSEISHRLDCEGFNDCPTTRVCTINPNTWFIVIQGSKGSHIADKIAATKAASDPSALCCTICALDQFNSRTAVLGVPILCDCKKHMIHKPQPWIEILGPVSFFQWCLFHDDTRSRCLPWCLPLRTWLNSMYVFCCKYQRKIDIQKWYC